MMRKFKLIKNYPGFNMPCIAEEDKDGFFSIRGSQISYNLEYFERYPEYWEEVKILLFVTEDGVNIYELPIYVFIIIKNKANLSYKQITVHYSSLEMIKSWSVFHNEDEAIRYIEENRPKFSVKQLRDAINKIQNPTFYGHGVFSQRLKKELGI